MARLNLHKLLKGTPFTHGFLQKIDVLPSERSLLYSARSEIRDHIRTEFAQISHVFDARAIFTEAYFKDNRNSLDFADPIEFTPKFATQGSFQYKTVNWPARLPPQEVDLDDGIYVAMPYHAGQPILAPNTYFAVVERALLRLCEEHGWTMNVDKNSCVRINLQTGNSHIDLPLYGVPIEEFERITHEMASQGLNPSQVAFAEAMQDFNSGLRVDHTAVQLATRDKGWISSDPQELNDWFNKAVKDHGGQLRDVCRFLKAWRDHNWDDCRLSSITLMTAVVEAYDQGFGSSPPERPAASRIDLVLQKTVDYLTQSLAGPIVNPAIPVG